MKSVKVMEGPELTRTETATAKRNNSQKIVSSVPGSIHK